MRADGLVGYLILRDDCPPLGKMRLDTSTFPFIYLSCCFVPTHLFPVFNNVIELSVY